MNAETYWLKPVVFMKPAQFSRKLISAKASIHEICWFILESEMDYFDRQTFAFVL